MDNQFTQLEALEILNAGLQKDWLGRYKIPLLRQLGLKNVSSKDLAVYILQGKTAAQARGINIQQIELYLHYFCLACGFISQNICPLVPSPNDH